MKPKTYVRYLTKKFYLKILLFIIDNFLALIIRKKKRLIPENIKKILIIKPDHLGDMLLFSCVLPLIKEKFPEAKIDIICGSWTLPILENNPFINKKLIVDHPFANRKKISKLKKISVYYKTLISLILSIRKEKYDLGLFMRSRRGNLAFLSLFGKIRFTIGHGTAGFGPAFNLQIPWKSGIHEIEHFLEILKPLGIKATVHSLTYHIYPSKRSEEKIKHILKEKVKGKKKIAIVHPGSGNIMKTLFIDQWKKIVSILESKKYQVILTGSLSEIVFTSSISSQNSINLTGLLNIHELALIYKKASLIITVDSLSSHLAGWSETKAIVYFSGLVDKNQWEPLGKNIKNLYIPVECAPCESGCKERKCMNFNIEELERLI